MSAGALAALGLGVLLLGAPPSIPARRRLVAARARRAPPTVGAAPTRPRPAWLLPTLAGLGVGVLGAILFGRTGVIAAAVTVPVAVIWVARHPGPQHPPDRTARTALPLVLDLMAAALRAGATTATALAAVTAAAPPSLRDDLGRTAALLRLGATPAEAWNGLRTHPVLGPVALVATRSADSGIRLAEGLERQAGEVRAEIRAAGVARAHRVATMSLLPLGVCFLPAFVILGVVPIVIGVAGDAFTSIAP